MRKLLVAAALTVALVALATPAGAVSQWDAKPNYAVTTNQSGVIECASGYAEVGEALAPDYLYVFTRAYRTQGYLCSGGLLGGPGSGVARVEYTLYWLTPFGVWLTCHTGVAFNAIGSGQAVLDNAYLGCGNYQYLLSASYRVWLRGSNGNATAYDASSTIITGVLNG